MLPLSAIRENNDKLRIDSGYFSKPMLEADEKVRSYPDGHDELGVLFARFVKGIFDINADSYVEIGVPFLRILNLRQGVIDDSNLAMIPEGIHEQERKTELLKNDIVLSKTAYPAASIVNLERCNTSQDTIATTLSMYGKDNYFPEAIVAYLNSSLGERLLWRQFQGNVQLHLSLDDGRKVPVPRLGKKIQEKISYLFNASESLRNQCDSASKRAESILLRALGLENWQPPDPISYQRSSRDVMSAERLDADHFQEKFIDAKKSLDRAGVLEWIPLAELVTDLTNGHTPLRHDLSEGEIPFLCAEHIHDFEINFSSEKRILLEHHTHELSRTALRNGDILLTIKGKIGNAAIVENIPGSININQDVALLRLNDTLPQWWVVTFLNSFFGKLFAEQYATGAINPFLGLFSVKKICIPRFEILTMNQIVEQTRQGIHSARTARLIAKNLLEAAKRAVEIAIEQNETVALAYLREQESLHAAPPPAAGQP